MSAAERSLVEAYLVELSSRATAIQKRCDALLTRDYISESPRKLARVIRALSQCLSKAAVGVVGAIAWDDENGFEPDLQILRSTDNLIQQLGAQLRYVDGAQTDRLPWSTVRSFEKLVQSLLPGIDIMLRPQWNYNYASHIQDFREAYRKLLSEYEDFLPDDDLDKVLIDLPNPFHILTFPALERKNILLHSLLGHEIGHLLVDQFLTEERRASFIQALLPQLREYTSQQLKSVGLTDETVGGLFQPFAEEQFLTLNTVTTVSFWERALEELLSDVAGTILFGPAALFSTLEMAMQQGMDLAPTAESNFYPPWRKRLRVIVEVLNTLEDSQFFPVDETLFLSADSKDRATRVNDRHAYVKDQ